jgi:hypothetical protein
MSPRRLGALLVLAMPLAGCGVISGPGLGDILAARAVWRAKGIHDYAYDYRVDRFFINYAGRAIHLVVRADSVVSATYRDTGEPLPGTAGYLPTVDRLFERAIAAFGGYGLNTLRSISFDPGLGYPRFMQLDGPPDAGGSVTASGLQPLP